MSWVEKSKKINNQGGGGGDDYSGLESKLCLHPEMLSSLAYIIKLLKITTKTKTGLLVYVYFLLHVYLYVKIFLFVCSVFIIRLRFFKEYIVSLIFLGINLLQLIEKAG